MTDSLSHCYGRSNLPQFRFLHFYSFDIDSGSSKRFFFFFFRITFSISLNWIELLIAQPKWRRTIWVTKKLGIVALQWGELKISFCVFQTDIASYFPPSASYVNENVYFYFFFYCFLQSAGVFVSPTTTTFQPSILASLFTSSVGELTVVKTIHLSCNSSRGGADFRGIFFQSRFSFCWLWLRFTLDQSPGNAFLSEAFLHIDSWNNADCIKWKK